MNKILEFAELTPEELKAKKKQAQQELLTLRLQQQSGQLKKPSLLRSLRRDVARIETLLSAKGRNQKINFRKPKKGNS